MDTSELEEKLAEVEEELFTKPLGMVETERCTGHCCRRFYLPYSPQHLQAEYEESQRRGYETIREIGTIWPMLIYLEHSDIDVTGAKRNEPAHYYTCKHYDTASGNCTNYENRPRMCSDYPYGSTCRYTNCTRKEEPLQGPREKLVQLKGCMAKETKAAL